MNSNQVKLNDLPELPFEKILSYLPLEDLLRSRAVSRRWYQVISRFRPKCLAYSRCPKHFIFEKNRIVSGAFVQNFISSLRFESFFGSFSQRILSNLKNLRLCELSLCEENGLAFGRALSSFDQLKELGLFNFSGSDSDLIGLELNLPMLKSIHLESLEGIEILTLDAPKLENVKVWCCCALELVIVRGELVERLVTDQVYLMNVRKLKSLKHLYLGPFYLAYSDINFAFLSSLEQLKEIHLGDADDVRKVFEQKQRYGRSNLKIFLFGVLLDSPDDPAIESISDFRNKEYMRYLADPLSKVANEIPLYFSLQYSAIECLAPSEIGVLNRFTDCTCIEVHEPVQDIDRFLGLLKSFDNIVQLDFKCDQPQELLDRLPDHCAVQRLFSRSQPLQDLNFLFRLKSLIYLEFRFKRSHKTIRFDVEVGHPMQFNVSVDLGQYKTVSDLDDAIKFIIEIATEIEKAN